MRVTVIGTGYVGLVTGSCLSATGNHVVCVDKEESKISALNQGVIPIHEPGLDSLVESNVEAGRLEFTTDFHAAVQSAQIIFIAVGTPSGDDGSADLSAVEEVARQIGRSMNGRKVVVDKSTVPVGTANRVREIIASETKHDFAVVSNPEFLKEGAAIEDFMKPDRIIIGTDDELAIEAMRALYSPYMRRGDRLLVMDTASAEMAKYASNAMLATRISFMNEVAELCERVGANVEQVRRGMAMDVRIGGHFLFPGAGFGGSCFPKDLRALHYTGVQKGMEMRILDAVSRVNKLQKRKLVEKVHKAFGPSLIDKTFAIWGLAFKPGTDDMREAPALDVIDGLLAAGAKVRATDPAALEEAGTLLGRTDNVTLSDDPYAILDGADGLLLLTEWNEYRTPDFETIATSLRTGHVFDGRNVWNRKLAEAAGLAYHGIGL
ncbi:MAG: UDP-glucose dehydrogenase family protein [Planctomycetota bacterium]|jgi:UDPglucose 6-dehydrogenase